MLFLDCIKAVGHDAVADHAMFEQDVHSPVVVGCGPGAVSFGFWLLHSGLFWLSTRAVPGLRTSSALEGRRVIDAFEIDHQTVSRGAAGAFLATFRV